MIKRVLQIGGLLIVAGYAAALTVMYFQQTDMIFDQRTVPQDHDWGFAEGVDVITLERPDGVVYGAYHPGPEPGKAVTLFFHGNGQNLGASPRMAELFGKLGYDLLAVERRLSGKSYGHMSEEALYGDAAAWYDYARERWPEADIRVVGYSMGTAWATALAAERREVRDVVLFAPFNSLSFMAKYRTWWMPGPLLDAVMAYPLRSDLNILQADQARFRIYHGTADPTVPYISGAMLQDQFNGDDNFITLEGLDHWDVIWNPDTFADLQQSWGRSRAGTLAQEAAAIP